MLRPELPAGEPGAAACVVRLPDGRRVSRRFRPSDDLDQLFAWVDSQGGGGADFGPYNLVRAILRPCQTLGTCKHLALSYKQYGTISMACYFASCRSL